MVPRVWPKVSAFALVVSISLSPSFLVLAGTPKNKSTLNQLDQVAAPGGGTPDVQGSGTIRAAAERANILAGAAVRAELLTESLYA